nr:PIN domain-containing protein [Klebsiella pneumoniae]
MTDVVRSEIEKHLKKYAEEAVTAHKNFRKAGSFLCVAEEVTGGGLFPDIASEAVLAEARRKFHALVDNGLTETVLIAEVNPKQIFDDYFSGAAPFHREAKKSEFPDAFSLAAVDTVAKSRHHSVYIVSNDDDMSAVAAANESFIYLKSIDVLLDLVNRNDKELSELSDFADSILDQLRDQIINLAREIVSNGEFILSSYDDADPEICDVAILSVNIHEVQLIDVATEYAMYDVTFNVELTVSYNFEDYSRATWDKEEHVYYGVEYSRGSFRHQEQYAATLEIESMDRLRANAEVHSLSFDDSLFGLDLDTAVPTE